MVPRLSADAPPLLISRACAACSGFVYAMNMADTLIRSGRFRTIAVTGRRIRRWRTTC